MQIWSLKAAVPLRSSSTLRALTSSETAERAATAIGCCRSGFLLLLLFRGMLPVSLLPATPT